MNYTLITGASKGIGRALAREFAGYHCNLVLTARSTAELAELAEELSQTYKIDVKTISLDLLEKESPEKLFNFCQDQQLFIRILVNNAGYGIWKAFEESSLDEQFSMMQLNQRVLVELCHRFIPMLREMPNAHILNVASTAAFQPFPGFSTYAASKAFVYSFTRSLRYELKGAGINVSCLCPGPTDTDFFSNANFKHKIGETDGIKMSVEEVAKKGVEDLLSKKAVSIPGVSNRLGAFMSKHLPVGLTASLLGRMLKHEPQEQETD